MSKKEKKDKKAIWIADEYAAIPAHIANRVPLAMLWAKPKLKKQKRKDVVAFYMNAYAEGKAKAVVGPRELVEASENLHPTPQMGWGKTATIPLVEPTKKYLEVREDKGDRAEFEKMPDGTFYVSIEGQSDDRFQVVSMTPEQFAAFKQWVMEN